MKVFVSWSGERSKRVGELLGDWLACVLQSCKPWLSARDIDRGALWFSEITDQLRDTAVGIICLTNENKEKPWIQFEAGALAKGLTTSRVCTLLIDLTPDEIRDPLAQFNHTIPNQEGIFSLVKTINASLEDRALDLTVLRKVFETYWGQFETQFQTIISETEDSKEGPRKKDKQSTDSLLIEILESTRSLGTRLRRLEMSSDRNSRSDDSESARLLSLRQAHQIVEALILGNAPKEAIYEVLGGRVPGNWLERVLSGDIPLNYLRKPNSSDSKIEE